MNMKIRPTKKSGGVVVELKRTEAMVPGAAPRASTEPLPIFKLRRILVPVDFSECSRKALQYAVPFARQFEASLVLLHVVHPYLPVPEMSTVDSGLIETQMRADGTKALAALKKSLADEVPSETALRVGNPQLEITRAVRDLGIDLIILATHGRSGLAHIFLGSVAERVVRHAPCPVLVVREGEHEFVGPRATTQAANSSANSRVKNAGNELIPAS
jgi:nucleotide-binding universal stress UspA family protein